MKILKIIIFTILLGAANSTIAQDLDEALRYMKVGNTYREVDEFDLSESYLKRSLSIITTRFPNQKYWEAAICENLGLLYRDNGEKDDSQRYFIRAIEIYRTQGYAASVKAIQKLLTSVESKEEFFAGFDVGATGIKMSVLGVKLNGQTRKLEIKTTHKFKNANINLGVKNISAYKEGAKAIASYVNDSLASFNIPAEKVIIALSSGLVGRIGSDTASLKEEIRTALGNPNLKIDVVDYKKEAELTIRGAVPQSQWYNCSVIDIGSGNTKGGYFIRPVKTGDAPTMMGIEFPGTKTYASEIEKKYDPKDFTEYMNAIENETKDLSLQIRREFDERRPEMKKRKYVYLLGGASYVTNMLMSPDSVKEARITMNKFNVASFKKKLMTDIVTTKNPDLSKIYDSSKRALAEEKISEINTKIFPRDEDLASATFLVNAFTSEITRNIVVKEVVFLSGTDTAWITGLVRETIQKQYGR